MRYLPPACHQAAWARESSTLQVWFMCCVSSSTLGVCIALFIVGDCALHSKRFHFHSCHASQFSLNDDHGIEHLIKIDIRKVEHHRGVLHIACWAPPSPLTPTNPLTRTHSQSCWGPSRAFHRGSQKLDCHRSARISVSQDDDEFFDFIACQRLFHAKQDNKNRGGGGGGASGGSVKKGISWRVALGGSFLPKGEVAFVVCGGCFGGFCCLVGGILASCGSERGTVGKWPWASVLGGFKGLDF